MPVRPPYSAYPIPDSGSGGFIPNGPTTPGYRDDLGKLHPPVINNGPPGSTGGIPMGGVPGSTAGVLPSTPAASVANTIAGAVPTGMPAAAGSNMWAALIPIITSLVGAYAGSRNSGANAGSGDINALMAQFPELRQALTLQNTQAQRQDPLHAALTQLGMNLLPRTAFAPLPRTGALPSWPNSGIFPNSPQAPQSGPANPSSPSIEWQPGTGGGPYDEKKSF